MHGFRNRFCSILLLLIIPILFWSCSNRKTSKASPQSYELIRFESIFFDTHPDSLKQVEQRFPYFFPKSYPFSVWVNRRTDSLQLTLYEQTKSISNSDIQDQLNPFMDGLPRVFENARVPKKVFTITSDVDYNNKVILNDSMVFIAIDNFFCCMRMNFSLPSFFKMQMCNRIIELCFLQYLDIFSLKKK